MKSKNECSKFYVIGVLRTLEFLAVEEDQPTMARDIRLHVLDTERDSDLRALAAQEGIRFPKGFWQSAPAGAPTS